MKQFIKYGIAMAISAFITEKIMDFLNGLSDKSDKVD